MKLLTVFKLSAALALTMASFLVFMPSSTKVSAHEISASQEKEVYSYVAQPGDSYTEIARKAIQTFGLIEKIDVSPAGIVFAETNLTREAGSPELNEGQKVEIPVAELDNWVDESLKLSDSQEAAWDYYVQFVNFNTDAVGQSS